MNELRDKMLQEKQPNFWDRKELENFLKNKKKYKNNRTSKTAMEREHEKPGKVWENQWAYPSKAGTDSKKCLISWRILKWKNSWRKLQELMQQMEKRSDPADDGPNENGKQRTRERTRSNDGAIQDPGRTKCSKTIDKLRDGQTGRINSVKPIKTRRKGKNKRHFG